MIVYKREERERNVKSRAEGQVCVSHGWMEGIELDGCWVLFVIEGCNYSRIPLISQNLPKNIR